MPLLFSYGTLRQADVQMAQFGRLLESYPDALLGWRLETVVINDPDVVAKSGSDCHPILRRSGNSSDRVDGAVFDLTDAELAAADAYEVDDYRRAPVTTLSGRSAWAYVARQET